MNQTKPQGRLKEILTILKRNNIIKGLTPLKLRTVIEEMGPTYIKLGQVMSMRSDMIPYEYCEELMKLRTEVPPMPFDDVINQIEDSLGGSFTEFFSSLDKTPIGSASIAQVHKGVLLDGTTVVVKIQRIGIYDIMAKDITLLRRASKILKLSGTTGNVLDFDIILDELWTTTQEELDFLTEARHIQHFAEAHKDINYMRVPTIFKQYSTNKVLVMEFIKGTPINHIKTLKELGYDTQEIAEKLADNYAKQIVDDGYFHADPHPGNLIISGGKIAWIDFGMMGSLTKRNQQLFLEAIEAIVQNDITRIKDIVLTIGIATSEIHHTNLYSDIDTLLSKYGSTDLNSLSMGNVLNDLMEAAKKHNISMPSGLTMMARGVGTLEGVMKELESEISFIDILANHIKPNLLDKDYIEEQAQKITKNTYQSLNSLLGVPALLKDALQMTIKGQSKIGMDLDMSTEFKKSANQMTNNIVLGLIISSLFISSSLISTTDMVPTILGIPALGVLGYTAASVLSVKILINIFKYH